MPYQQAGLGNYGLLGRSRYTHRTYLLSADLKPG